MRISFESPPQTIIHQQVITVPRSKMTETRDYTPPKPAREQMEITTARIINAFRNNEDDTVSFVYEWEGDDRGRVIKPPKVILDAETVRWMLAQR